MSDISKQVRETLEDWLQEYCAEFFYDRSMSSGMPIEEIRKEIVRGVMAFSSKAQLFPALIQEQLKQALRDAGEYDA